MLAKWPSREEGPTSYRVPIEKIRESDWSLATGRYKAVITASLDHDDPAEILVNVLNLENAILQHGNDVLARLRSTK
jgi:hypothetical protein